MILFTKLCINIQYLQLEFFNRNLNYISSNLRFLVVILFDRLRPDWVLSFGNRIRSWWQGTLCSCSPSSYMISTLLSAWIQVIFPVCQFPWWIPWYLDTTVTPTANSFGTSGNEDTALVLIGISSWSSGAGVFAMEISWSGNNTHRQECVWVYFACTYHG